MLEISLGITLFTAIVLVLVLVILFARAKLVAHGDVFVTINKDHKLKAAVGSKLLIVLNDAGVHLPAACGGRGTCGQCNLHVFSGGGAILPTETAHITRRQAAQGARLACQVTIKQEMDVQVSKDILGVKQWACTVRSNESISTLIKELVLELPAGETIEFRAGGYVQIDSPSYQARFSDFNIAPAFSDEWKRLDLWRYEAGTKQPTTRAYSMANYPDENNIIMLDVRIAIPPPGAAADVPPGVVSSYIFNLKPGDKVTVSGPFGNFFTSESKNEMVFIGGGVGMAPMRSMIFDQLKRLNTARKITFWYGARNKRELIYHDDFNQLQTAHENFHLFVALSEPEPEDKWTGMTGFIHEALYENYLKDHPTPEECDYYLCGPPLMIKAVRNMLDSLGVDPDSIFFDDFGG